LDIVSLLIINIYNLNYLQKFIPYIHVLKNNEISKIKLIIYIIIIILNVTIFFSWVDSDVILVNPNIKLETFLPNEKMDLIHLIVSNDYNGLNCGVFFIRVHPWSLNFIMRAYSYFYYHPERYLLYADQSSINNVLTSSNDTDDHYIIVPQYWFNSYIGDKEKGEFLVHLAGKRDKSIIARLFRLQIKSDPRWFTAMTSKDLRKKVLEYYKLPKEQQQKIYFQ